jgi:zinc D-Ala-D-Ala carboxypeptidase
VIEAICVWSNVAICFAIMVICVRRQGCISGTVPRAAGKGRLSNALLGTGALVMVAAPARMAVRVVRVRRTRAPVAGFVAMAAQTFAREGVTMATRHRDLSQHFTLSELTASQTAVRADIPNTPTASVLVNLERLAAVLERVREALHDSPIVISSEYRSPKVNAMVGGAPNSAHTKGLAADFTCPSFGPPRDVCRAIVDAGIAFDQLIYEGAWVHLGLAETEVNPRGQVLTAVFAKYRPTCYMDGLV